jgi:hypothetical protein
MSDSPRTTFFRITVGLLALLVLAGVAIALLVGFNIDRINRDGGYAILMAIFVFVVLMAIIGVATIVTSALSLRKGEAHRGFSIVVLILSSLVVLTFGTRFAGTMWSQWRQSQEAARTTHEPRVFGNGGTEIPPALVEHLRREGFPIRPARERSSSREYVVDVAGLGTRCEVLVSFRGFARGIPIEPVKKKLMEFSAASVLNELARLAMFHPVARGKTGDKNDCEAWAVKSQEIVEPLLDAFRSYRP